MKKFVAGLLAGIVVIPVLFSITDLLQVCISALSVFPNKIIAKANRELIQGSADESNACAIGFQLPEEECEEYEEF